jgi:hypothetical protein
MTSFLCTRFIVETNALATVVPAPGSALLQGRGSTLLQATTLVFVIRTLGGALGAATALSVLGRSWPNLSSRLAVLCAAAPMLETARVTAKKPVLILNIDDGRRGARWTDKNSGVILTDSLASGNSLISQPVHIKLFWPAFSTFTTSTDCVISMTPLILGGSFPMERTRRPARTARSAEIAQRQPPLYSPEYRVRQFHYSDVL